MLKTILSFLFFCGCIFNITYLASVERPIDPLSINLEGYDYPYQVNYHPISYDGKPGVIAYMDVMPPNYKNGKTIVLLHAGYYNSSYWKHNISYFVEHGFRVVAIDQVGFGKSSKFITDFSLERLANNVQKLLTALKINSASLVAHHMGASVATRLAFMYPKMVSHLILVSPAGMIDKRKNYKTIEDFYVIVKERFSSYKGIDKTIAEAEPYNKKRGYHNAVKGNHVYLKEIEKIRTEFQRLMLSPDADKRYLILALTMHMEQNQPILCELASIKIPTLIIAGKANGFINFNDDFLLQVTNVMPNARYVLLDNVGHLVHIQARGTFNQIIIDFIKTN